MKLGFGFGTGLGLGLDLLEVRGESYVYIDCCMFSKAGFPNLWAATHYRAMAYYSQPGCVRVRVRFRSPWSQGWKWCLRYIVIGSLRKVTANENETRIMFRVRVKVQSPGSQGRNLMAGIHSQRFSKENYIDHKLIPSCPFLCKKSRRGFQSPINSDVCSVIKEPNPFISAKCVNFTNHSYIVSDLSISGHIVILLHHFLKNKQSTFLWSSVLLVKFILLVPQAVFLKKSFLPLSIWNLLRSDLVKLFAFKMKSFKIAFPTPLSFKKKELTEWLWSSLPLRVSVLRL